MEIPFIKCHGSGNDFILIDETEQCFQFTEKQRKELSLLLCDREQGVGSDGILFVIDSEKAEARMRMFNSDGTEAEMCGNGLRCVARRVIEKIGKTNVSIETDKAVLSVSQVDQIYPEIDTFAVAIEPVSFSVKTLPLLINHDELVEAIIPELSNERLFTALSVPNPHIISIVDKIDQTELLHVGQKANALPAVFPNGVNVSFVEILASNKIFVQTFERGVGLTNACGTAMSASSLVSVLLGANTKDTPITVINKGGVVNCVVEKQGEDYSIELRGNATNVYRAVAIIDLQNKQFQVMDRHTFHDENEKYDKLKSFAHSQIGG